ncbi:MAG: bifunctional phosphoribosylaminoimidazolecarboxamide formyltransferase/IMP cyclohydrolase [Thermoplasmata archaeon]|nr:bifunctional phosphoribosylaminoimidazolecarboxamide formyltransferase/IMP cyclohydrolase [Thermoplasmata archaeon]
MTGAPRARRHTYLSGSLPVEGKDGGARVPRARPAPARSSLRLGPFRTRRPRPRARRQLGRTRGDLERAGIAATPAEDLTGVADWFGGRVKTLHPGLLGGILAPRTPSGEAELTERHLRPIDLVVSNLYPFGRHLAEHPDAQDLEEYIDIGGVTLARAAAKNHAYVAVLTDPAQYDDVAAELSTHHGALTAVTRRRLAVAAFERTAEYDRLIASALGGRTALDVFPESVEFLREPIELRYGENPHQRAAVYWLGAPSTAPMSPQPFESLKGAALSFTNLLDLDTALTIVSEFPTPTAAVVKHATPCGVASAPTISEALRDAIATDPVARYGCVVATNRPIASGDTEALHGVFVDLLAAPSFDPLALPSLEKRAKLKLVRVDPPSIDLPRWEAHSALGRLLLQEADRRPLVPGDLRPVTGRTASAEEVRSLDFAWRVARHAKSNAIVLVQGSRTVGIGSGQPTRVKAVELAVEVAGDRAKGSVLASDAFFPFVDGLEVAGRAGVAAILQPGGSLRDTEVIQSAERWGIAMYFTGWRIFRH